jgi:hypothetical protein
VPLCDEWADPDCKGNRTLKFERSVGRIGDRGYRVSFNAASSFVDASMVYGATQSWNDRLRAGFGGLLKVSSGPHGDLLPLNGDIGFDMAPGGNTSHLFAAGDFRANVNLPMVTLHTLFHLEHNWRARQIAEENPEWADQEIFEHARKYVIALVQKEFYYHYVPLVTGRPLPPYSEKGYNKYMSAEIDTTFMTSAFRYGHSATSNMVYLMKVSEFVIQYSYHEA